MRYWYKTLFVKRGRADVAARFGRWMASDNVGEIKDRIYLLPSISLYFNHSEIFFEFAWLTFSCYMWYKDWIRADAYRRKMQGMPQYKAEYDIGDIIEIIPTGKMFTIIDITDTYYDLGYTEDGMHIIADLRFPEQYRLYKPSLAKRIKQFFTW